MPKAVATLSDIDIDIKLVERVLALKEDIGNDYPGAVNVWKDTVVRTVEALCEDVDTIACEESLSDIDRIGLLEELIAVNRKVKAHGVLDHSRISNVIEGLLSLTAENWGGIHIVYGVDQ